MRARFTLDSDWRNLRSMKYKLKYSLDLDCLETLRNLDDVFNQHSVLYNNN